MLLMKNLKCGNKTLDLSRPAVMGILNATPDSFSDGGLLYSAGQLDQSKTLQAVESMLAAGADIIENISRCFQYRWVVLLIEINHLLILTRFPCVTGGIEL